MTYPPKGLEQALADDRAGVVCGDTYDHDTETTHSGPDGEGWRCVHCGAEGFEPREPAIGPDGLTDRERGLLEVAQGAAARLNGLLAERSSHLRYNVLLSAAPPAVHGAREAGRG
ncbi:hypothetical protein [Kitasatospora viridis]|uniref:Uncharacterized protein n=1 Tax=Kitasatospora viridis TaxID=281105 RepID=A0A561SA05_9ACTN|nr:hypothetical protein [Kitasatospora viridis]TWF71709.1 hypothetical protein FHX73_1880 [Kitasatospora viridis]